MSLSNVNGSFSGNIVSEVEFKNHQKSCIELRRMLVSSITTLKEKSK